MCLNNNIKHPFHLFFLHYLHLRYKIVGMFNIGSANKNQKAAICATEGLVLITAGPGTGKTFTLVKRAALIRPFWLLMTRCKKS